MCDVARRSIYLPDDLDTQVQQSPIPFSQLVQDLLRQHLSSKDSLGFPAPEFPAAMVTRHVRQAAQDFMTGQSQALERLTVLDWIQLDQFAQAGYSSRKWLQPWIKAVQDALQEDCPDLAVNGIDFDPASYARFVAREKERQPWIWMVFDDLGEGYHPFEASTYRTSTFVRGYESTLRQAHRMVQDTLRQGTA